jgi:hypothetical protein
MVGDSDDDTLSLVCSIPSDKIKVFETTWDDSKRTGGTTLALETDKAFAAIPEDADWCIYIQADEVLHEKYHATVRTAMEKYKDNPSVEGLLFHYKHFYGSYDYLGNSWTWYRHEIRILRKDKNIFSYKDAQGFRKRPHEKLRVKLIDAYIYHYGWVRDPRAMQHKQRAMNHFYHDDQWIDEHVAKVEEFDYTKIDSLERFVETHPKTMHDRIRRMNWKFDFDLSKNRLTTREKLKRFISFLLGRRVGEYKNYKII